MSGGVIDQSSKTRCTAFRVDSEHGTDRSAIFFPCEEFGTPIREMLYTENIAFEPPELLSGPQKGQAVTTGAATVGGSFFPEFKPGRLMTPSKPKGSSGKP